jgi:hypothetical protein
VSDQLGFSGVPPNINKKNYRLADMSMKPDEEVPYPDPNEAADVLKDRIDMAEFGTVLHVREWRGQDDTVEQFALILNVTPAHNAYIRCKKIKGDQKNFEQVRRTDTWHSTVHSHQYFIDCDYCERQVHEELAGGIRERESRRIVNGMFQKHYYEMLYDPSDYLDLWEAGKP